MMLGNRSTTCAVDVFSLGCVYYFVLTNGSHPFGESFRRQANILTGEYNLDKMSDERWSTARSLIEKMISVEHTHRPTTTAVLKHPMFWPSEKVLNFLQDVSDRVDKETFDSAFLVAIERNKLEVVRNNWYDLLDPQVGTFQFLPLLTLLGKPIRMRESGSNIRSPEKGFFLFISCRILLSVFAL